MKGLSATENLFEKWMLYSAKVKLKCQLFLSHVLRNKEDVYCQIAPCILYNSIQCILYNSIQCLPEDELMVLMHTQQLNALYQTVLVSTLRMATSI